jgi:hypothetical protein
MALCPVGTIVIFFLSFIFRLVILPEPIGARRAWHTKRGSTTGTKTDSGFLSGSLPELSPVEVYVIHSNALGRWFFPFGNQFGGEEARFCAIFTQNETSLFGL